ncbi:putative origin recognition complex, subunit 1 [Helianthus anomalus]
MEYEEEDRYNKPAPGSTPAHEVAANSRKGHTFGLQKIGTKRIPEHVRTHKQTELEKAKATLLLATLPKSLPCRNKEMEDITAFIKGAICDDQCLGRCLYIHGVPGTGKLFIDTSHLCDSKETLLTLSRGGNFNLLLMNGYTPAMLQF